MHLVLRSTKAKGEWSFRKPRNEANVNRIVDKFAYRPFIRAVTSAIAMAITGVSRWTKSDATKNKSAGLPTKREKFWDYRPYTRVVESFKAWDTTEMTHGIC